jgi:hypothetical protein
VNREQPSAAPASQLTTYDFLKRKEIAMPRGDGTGPRGRGTGAGRGAGAGIGIIAGVTGIVWDFLRKYKRGEFSNSFQGPAVQSHFGMGGEVEKARVSAPTPQAPSPVSTSGELEDLKKKSGELKDQLDRITERLSKLEAKK